MKRNEAVMGEQFRVRGVSHRVFYSFPLEELRVNGCLVRIYRCLFNIRLRVCASNRWKPWKKLIETCKESRGQ